MLIYVLLYVWFVALYGLYLANEKRICKNNGSDVNPLVYRAGYVALSFGAIILMLGLRADFMGIDLLKDGIGYLPSFEQMSEYTFIDLYEQGGWQNYEIGYILLNKFVGSIWLNRQFFLFIVACLSVAPVAYVVYKYSENIFISVIVFMGLPTFVVQFSTLRLVIAMGIAFLSIYFVLDHKLWYFLALVLLASTFHSSALICVVIYPLFSYKNTKKSLIINVVVLAFIFLLRRQIYYMASMIVYGSVETDSEGAIHLLMFFVAVYLFSAYFIDLDNKLSNGMLNLFWVACAIQVMGNVFTEATRLGYYFNYALILLVPAVFKDMKDKTKPWFRYLAMVLLVGFFIWFGYFEISTTSWSMSNPYYFFWNAPKMN